MRLSILTAAAAVLAAAACSPTGAGKSASAQAGTRTAEQEKNLATFDDLDFNVYSDQKWDEFHKSHAENIIVHYPDGGTTTGLPEHLEMLKPQFVFAPDTVIKEHPIKLADGEYTAVQGFMEGTFSAPMPLPDGSVIEPNGKRFKLGMLTVGRWENGVMAEEWLYWDNQAFMKQIGLAE